MHVLWLLHIDCNCFFKCLCDFDLGLHNSVQYLFDQDRKSKIQTMEQLIGESIKLRHRLIQLSRYSDSEKKSSRYIPLSCYGILTKVYHAKEFLLWIVITQQDWFIAFLLRPSFYCLQPVRQWFELVSIECFAMLAFRVIKHISHFSIPSKTSLLTNHQWKWARNFRLSSMDNRASCIGYDLMEITWKQVRSWASNEFHHYSNVWLLKCFLFGISFCIY